MEKQFEFLIYKSADEEVSVNAMVREETIWLTQKGMAELFGCSADNIGVHLRNIYSDKELSVEATTEKISVVRQEGNRQVKRSVDFYNLDAIISVGYRVNSVRATHFRIWATGILKEYMIKGFAMDDERLKQRRANPEINQIRDLAKMIIPSNTPQLPVLPPPSRGRRWRNIPAHRVRPSWHPVCRMSGRLSLFSSR